MTATETITREQLTDRYTTYTYADCEDGFYEITGRGGHVNHLATYIGDDDTIEVVSEELAGWGYDHFLIVHTSAGNYSIMVNLK